MLRSMNSVFPAKDQILEKKPPIDGPPPERPPQKPPVPPPVEPPPFEYFQ